MATFYSRLTRPLLTGLTAGFMASLGTAQAVGPPAGIFAERAAAEFHKTQSQYEKSDTAANAIPFARACFDFADFATNRQERSTIANLGISACRQVIASDPKSTAAHYYLGMNLGQLARAEFLGALRIVREMEREFKAAAQLDPNFDYAGPERCLGLLYRDAPGWPASIGSKRKAKTYLEEAARLAPGYPENRLNLVEADLKWHDSGAAEKELDALNALWPRAQREFTGEKWEREWADWSTRRDAADSRLEPPAPRRIGKP